MALQQPTHRPHPAHRLHNRLKPAHPRLIQAPPEHRPVQVPHQQHTLLAALCHPLTASHSHAGPYR